MRDNVFVCCACADNRAAAERWLSVLEGAGLRVVQPRVQPDATPTTSSSNTGGMAGAAGTQQAGEADGRLQDRCASVSLTVQQCLGTWLVQREKW